MQNNIFSGLFAGQNLVTLKEVDSTNNYLKILLSNSKPLIEGTVIMAENQFAGRGQMQNGWFTEAGKNLTFSLLLKPKFLSLNDQFDLNRAVSLGVYDTLVPLLGGQVKIKWPNDIYYADYKLGGILIENLVQGTLIRNSIAGIGLNVNQQVFPDDLPYASSLKKILNNNYDLMALLGQICFNIENWYLKLKEGKYLLVRSAYLKALYWFSEYKAYETLGTTFNGNITDVEADGGLVIMEEANKRHLFKFKEVKFLNHPGVTQ